MITRRTLILLLTQLLMVGSAFSHSFNNSRTIFDELEREEVLKVTLRADFSLLLADRHTDEAEKATFTYEDQDGREQTLEAKLELRGKYRRRICEFPPLMIKFKKNELRARGLSDHNDLKLVTHCLEDKLPGNENVLREYLAYKLYNQLTDRSYRVQLVRITYEDESGTIGRTTRYAFLIEDTDEMAERLGGEEFEKMNPSASELVTETENLLAAFQYMIGNEDWSLQMGRNVKLVRPLDGSPLIPVPYDFDFSGLVNASYAKPNTDIGLSSVRERAFLGEPRETEVLTKTLSLFKEKKEELYDTVRSFNALSRSMRGDIIQYLESFYDSMDLLLSENAAQLEAARDTSGGEGTKTGADPLGK